MPVEFTDLWPNKFGFDFDFIPDKCHIFPSFKIKNSSLSPVYVKATIVSGRYKFTDGSTVKELGSVGGATSKVFTMELVASPLNTHTSEKVTIEVGIYKYNTYTGLIDEFKFDVEIFYIDKGQCSVFQEVLVVDTGIDPWVLNSGEISNIADFDGSGYCLYRNLPGGVAGSLTVSRDVYGKGSNFVGCAIGIIKHSNNEAAVSLRFYIGKNKLMDYTISPMRSSSYTNKWYYVLFNIPNVGNTTVKIELYGYGPYWCNLYMDDLRYYEL